jgi:hypothetical protein
MTTCLNKSLVPKGLFQFPGLRPRLNNWTLVVNDTTSGLVNSRVIIYEHGTFQIRKKKSTEFTPRRLNGVKNLLKIFYD